MNLMLCSNSVIMFLLTICLLLELLYLSSASQIGCVIESTACQAHMDNNLGLYPDIQTIEECRQLCNDNRDCQFLTYYGEDSFPLLQVCELFNDCSEKKSCQNCVTESRGCYTCSDQYTGVLSGDNLPGHLYRASVSSNVSRNRGLLLLHILH